MTAPDAGSPRHVDLGAERAVLGCMMQSPAAVVEAEALLKPDAFYRHAHGLVFTTITGLAAKGEPTDAVAVASQLIATGQIDKVGGTTSLYDMIQAAPVGNIGYYAKIVAGYATLRRLNTALVTETGRVSAAGYDEAAKVAEQVLDALTSIEVGRPEGGPALWGDLLPSVLDEVERAGSLAPGEVPGVPTGLHDLDRLLGGFSPGEMIVLAARPGIGKTVLAANIAQHATVDRKLRVVFFSLEMRTAELGMRMLAAGTRIPLNAIRSGKLTDEDWEKITRFQAETADIRLHIDDTPAMTLGGIRSATKQIERQDGPVDLVIIDQLQLVETDSRENRQVAVSRLSRGIKVFAKAFNLPVLVVSQLNRGPEGRTDKRPQLSDLRESGSIESDADVVIFIHRDDAYDPESPRSGEADLIVAKSRHAAQDTITVAAQLHVSRFVSMAVV